LQKIIEIISKEFENVECEKRGVVESLNYTYEVTARVIKSLMRPSFWSKLTQAITEENFEHLIRGEPDNHLRVDVIQIDSLAKSAVCLIMERRLLRQVGDAYVVDLSRGSENTFSIRYSVSCEENAPVSSVRALAEIQEPFRTQPGVSGNSGTGFLFLRPNYIATAGHALKYIEKPKDMAFVFGHLGDIRPTSQFLIPNARVFFGVNVVFDGAKRFGTDAGTDFNTIDLAVIEIDRPVPDTIARPLSMPVAPPRQLGARLSCLGHPFGLTMKETLLDGSRVSGRKRTLRSGRVVELEGGGGSHSRFFFASNLEVFPGSSGSPVFDEKGQFVGMAIRMWDGIDIECGSPGKFSTTFLNCHEMRIVHILNNRGFMEAEKAID